MGIEFNANEILQIAERIENNGALFYRLAADQCAGARERDLFLGLATSEDGHKETFAGMRKELSEEERAPLTFDPEGETALYLQAFADGSVFDLNADPVTLLGRDKTPSGVIQTALGLEKDSIVFYLGIRDMVSERAGRNRVEAIIEEEMRHVRALGLSLASLRA